MFKRKPYKQEKNIDLILESISHLPILLLRKSSHRLRIFVNLFENKDLARRLIYEAKWKISLCRPEVLNIFTAMARRPETFGEDASFASDRQIYIVDKTNNLRFHVRKGTEGVVNRATCNGHSMFNQEEADMLWHFMFSIRTIINRTNAILQDIVAEKAIDKIFSAYKTKKGG